MILAGRLAIVAMAAAAMLTVIATTAGVAVEAHPIAKVVVAQIGWLGYATLSIGIVAYGIRILATYPFSEWGIRVIAVVKVTDALWDAWLIGHRPVAVSAAIDVEFPTMVVISVVALVSLLVVVEPGDSFTLPSATYLEYS